MSYHTSPPPHRFLHALLVGGALSHGNLIERAPLCLHPYMGVAREHGARNVPDDVTTSSRRPRSWPVPLPACVGAVHIGVQVPAVFWRGLGYLEKTWRSRLRGR